MLLAHSALWAQPASVTGATLVPAPVAAPGAAPVAAMAATMAAPLAGVLAVCAACHGGGGNAPLAGHPSLAGQPRLFVETQLVLIREGLREVPGMQGVMAGMSDETIIALASHYAAQPLRPAPAAPQAAKLQAGAALSRQQGCGSCHLPDYRGQQQVPRLAGQQEDYLQATLLQLRDRPGPGRDTVMAATLRGLSDSDLQALAHYLASQGASR